MTPEKAPTQDDGPAAERPRDTDADALARPGRRDTIIDETGQAGEAATTDPGGGPPVEVEDLGPTRMQPSPADGARAHDSLQATDVGLNAHQGAESFELPVEGEMIDERYLIERVIGRGATGVVYEVSHCLTGARLALKCLHPRMSTSPIAVQRLFREARISASLRHPNVMQVFDAGRDRDLYYLTMELLEGEPMSAYLARGPHPAQKIVRIFLSIMDGVAAVHGAGVVHRDLKPENVVLTRGEDGRLSPKVLDFGVSKLFEPDRQQLTSFGTTMGTPYYMAPEQVTDSRTVDVRADVYSLGVMLYEALAGRLPYAGESILEIFTLALEGRPAPLRELRPEVPPSLEALIARALCAERDGRYADVRALREALQSVPFDGSDLSQDWSDVSEPWMFDRSGGQVSVRPLDAVPTHVGARGKSASAASVANGSALERAVRDIGKLPHVRLWLTLSAALFLVLGASCAALLTAIFS